MPEIDQQDNKEELDRQAYEKGFDQGHRDGLELARKEMASKVEDLGNILNDLSAYRARICNEAEAQLLEMTLALAEVVIRHEASCRPETVRETLQAALEMAAENGNLKVHLNPEDLENVKQFLPQLEQRLNSATRLEIEGDPAISQGGCLVETDSGIIDARLEEQLETLRLQLRRMSEPRQQEVNTENKCD
jgi:flagellar assembly protein FliH